MEAVLLSTHMMLATFLQTPELAIDQAEANALAQGVKRVSRHYDTSISAKALDHIALGQAVVMVYGPRVAVMLSKGRKARGQGAGVVSEAPVVRSHDPNRGGPLAGGPLAGVVPFLDGAAIQ